MSFRFEGGIKHCQTNKNRRHLLAGHQIWEEYWLASYKILFVPDLTDINRWKHILHQEALQFPMSHGVSSMTEADPRLWYLRITRSSSKGGKLCCPSRSLYSKHASASTPNSDIWENNCVCPNDGGYLLSGDWDHTYLSTLHDKYFCNMWAEINTLGGLPIPWVK